MPDNDHSGSRVLDDRQQPLPEGFRALRAELLPRPQPECQRSGTLRPLASLPQGSPCPSRRGSALRLIRGPQCLAQRSQQGRR